MIQHITGGAWGVAIRRLLESGTRTLPVLALLFVPIALGVGHLYEWAQPEHVAHDPLLQHKCALPERALLPRPGGAATSLVWIAPGAIPVALVAASGRERRPRARDAGWRTCRAAGWCVLALTMTFAAIDWAMSLEPHWFSTIYGVIFIGGSALTAFALVIPIAGVLMQHAPVRGLVSADQLQRPREADARVRHAVGLLQLLAVPHHLVRQPARGDHLVPRAPAAAAGSGWRCSSSASTSPCRSSCCCRGG